MGQKLALLVGNSEYDDPAFSRLRKPAADVSALARVLECPNLGGFEDVVSLHDQRRPEIEQAIAAFFDKKSPDDLLLLYFSGHGVKDDEGYLYLAVKDTRLESLFSTGLAAEWVRRAMNRSRSRRQVLLLDCCHSGAFSPDHKAALGGSVGTKEAFDSGGYGRIILTATDSMQYAFEGDVVTGNADTSVFTRSLVRSEEHTSELQSRQYLV